MLSIFGKCVFFLFFGNSNSHHNEVCCSTSQAINENNRFIISYLIPWRLKKMRKLSWEIMTKRNETLILNIKCGCLLHGFVGRKLSTVMCMSVERAVFLIKPSNSSMNCWHTFVIRDRIKVINLAEDFTCDKYRWVLFIYRCLSLVTNSKLAGLACCLEYIFESQHELDNLLMYNL